MHGWAANISWSDLLGLIGVALYIGAYFALQVGLIRGQGYLYAALNTAAACCVLLSLTQEFNLSSAIIQVVYIAISVVGMARFYLLTHRIRFSDEELELLAAIAPNLTKWQARQLLDLGTWWTAPRETVLTDEGQPLSHLYFLADGGANVVVAGAMVAQVGAGSLIGEMSCLTGMPASATVTIAEPARLFALEVKTMNAFLARNQAVRHELESRFVNQISDKLIRANASLSART